MKTTQYPSLGSKVKYVRQIAPVGEIEQGEATVWAICLDHNKRVMVHLSKPSEETNAPDQKFNVDLSSVNPTDEYLTKFQQMAQNIKDTSHKGNTEAQAVIDEHNALVEAHYTEVLGAPIEFE